MAEKLDFKLLRATDTEIRQLIHACRTVKEQAYCVYSKFRVGAALLTDGDGERQIITGCNVENASYGLCICAERSAICQAIAKGFRRFSVIAVTTDVEGSFCTPCGACRQTLAEFMLDGHVLLVQPGFTEEQYMTGGEGVKIVSVRELLPFSFTPDDLLLPRMVL